jgi:hypothetical protein
MTATYNQGTTAITTFGIKQLNAVLLIYSNDVDHPLLHNPDDHVHFDLHHYKE